MVTNSALLQREKVPNAIADDTNSLGHFEGFLVFQGRTTDVAQISRHEIKVSILHLRQKRSFSNHRFDRRGDRGLSGQTIDCYLRSLRIGKQHNHE